MNLNREILQKFTNRLNSDSISYLTKEEQYYYNNIDFFQLNYVEYLIGSCKTRQRTFKEFRLLKESPLFKYSDFEIFLNEIECFLLEREMYESLILFVKTNKMFEKLKNQKNSFRQKIERINLVDFKVYYIRKNGNLRKY